MEEKFFTTEQVANILQVHPFTILKFIKQGKLKGIKLGRMYRIKESAINKFLEDRITKDEASDSERSQKAPKDLPSKNVPPKEKDEGDHYYII